MDESPRDDNDMDDERPGSSSMKEKQVGFFFYFG